MVIPKGSHKEYPEKTPRSPAVPSRVGSEQCERLGHNSCSDLAGGQTEVEESRNNGANAGGRRKEDRAPVIWQDTLVQKPSSRRDPHRHQRPASPARANGVHAPLARVRCMRRLEPNCLFHDRAGPLLEFRNEFQVGFEVWLEAFSSRVQKSPPFLLISPGLAEVHSVLNKVKR